MSQLLNTDKYGVSALKTKEMKTIDGGFWFFGPLMPVIIGAIVDAATNY